MQKGLNITPHWAVGRNGTADTLVFGLDRMGTNEGEYIPISALFYNQRVSSIF